MVTCRNWVKLSGVMAALAFLPTAANADSGCGLREVERFQTAVLQPAVEATPAYLQQTAESFISDCPDRFETRDAHLIAARGAMDSGQAQAAVLHFDDAVKRGARLTPVQRLDQSVALLAAGDDRAAVEARNLAIGDWLEKLAARGVTSIDVRKSRGGIILAVNFPRRDTEGSVHALWLAVPDGPGLPAAAVLRPDPMRASLRALRTGRSPAALTVLEQRTCQEARTLRETVQPAAIESFDRDASEAMRAYLRKPAALPRTEPGQPLASCLMPELMLHVPAEPS